MKLRPMLIGDREIAALQTLKQYAEINVLSFDDLLDIKNGSRPPPGHIKEHCTIIPYEYFVVFTIEEQPQPPDGAFKKFRHLSVSVGREGTKGVFPNPAAVWGLMVLLGFESPKLEDCKVFIEEEIAINVMELYT